MKKIKPVHSKFLRKKLNPEELDFKTTAELETLTDFVGQERAIESVLFGIGIKSQGYNLYAMGPSGVGKRSLLRTILEKHASRQSSPSDWCYIYNFEIPEQPIALQLPPGLGSVLQKDMKSLVTELGNSILAMLESDEYNNEMQKISDIFDKIKKVTSKKSKSSTKKVDKTNVKSQKSSNILQLYKERHKQEKEVQKKYSLMIIEPHIQKLIDKYMDMPHVVNYLSSVQKDILEHVNEFVRRDENADLLFASLDNPALVRYQVNLIVNNESCIGQPVHFEENPSYSNLICRVEHVNQFGALVTNFTLIKSGALHRANGGFLLLEARKIRKEPHAWEGLKRALYARKILIEPVEHLSETNRSISLEPMPIPLDIKVILMGDRTTYYTLSNNDPDFNELFKVAVDFDEQVSRNKTNIKLYARLIGTISRREGLRPLLADAVAAIIDQSTRLAQDVKKISTHVRYVSDLITEADYWAGLSNKEFIDESDIKKSISAQVHRIDRTRELYFEEINRNFIVINTSTDVVGQANCLSVVQVGKFSYGHPTRITAKVRMGKGKLIDIQREIDMSGPIHNKASLIISNFLASRYNTQKPYSLIASISFEQIYGMMEGDSASVAEVCALMSAIADVPLKQYLAITGSMDQHGVVQAVGGLNDKIEGFYDICKKRGLNGKQGVIIPAINVNNLMLREDIVAATKARKFSVYLIETIDDAISLLTDLTVGKRNKQGHFPEHSINFKIESRLNEFSISYTKNK